MPVLVNLHFIWDPIDASLFGGWNKVTPFFCRTQGLFRYLFMTLCLLIVASFIATLSYVFIEKPGMDAKRVYKNKYE